MLISAMLFSGTVFIFSGVCVINHEVMVPCSAGRLTVTIKLLWSTLSTCGDFNRMEYTATHDALFFFGLIFLSGNMPNEAE